MHKLKEIQAQYIVDENGNKQSVILPISIFQELMEDLEDLAKIAERKDEPAKDHKEFVEELKRGEYNF